jgi:serine/threonine protein phosphatase PrpC
MRARGTSDLISSACCQRPCRPAVSRAFGDYEFKGGRFDLLEDLKAEGSSMSKKATLEQPPVVPTPDVLEISRDVENDQFLIIASDGLWAGGVKVSTRPRLEVLWSVPAGYDERSSGRPRLLSQPHSSSQPPRGCVAHKPRLFSAT